MAAFSVALVVALALLWRFVRYRMKLAAALRAQQERERIADPDTISRYRWVEQDVVAEGAQGEESIEARIRAALEERRTRNSP